MAEPPQSEVIVYEFEQPSRDLERPPLAAIRALSLAGFLLSRQGWHALPAEIRFALAALGSREVVNIASVAQIMKTAPVTQVRLVPKSHDPDARIVPSSLVEVLGPARPISDADWQGLRGLDRYVLASLAYNSRLLWRALDELLRDGAPPSSRSGASRGWSAALAHCELRMRSEMLDLLGSEQFMNGRAFLLARVAGIRAARRAPETFGLQTEATAGAIELGWAVRSDVSVVLWQAHVSAWDGGFFPTASLLAAATATIALYDMVRTLDASAAISMAAIVEEGWQVGPSFFEEEPTSPH